MSHPHSRPILGSDRAALAQRLAKRYRNGYSIRQLATETGRSYGFVHNLLTEARVPLRPPGSGRTGGTPT